MNRHQERFASAMDFIDGHKWLIVILGTVICGILNFFTKLFCNPPKTEIYAKRKQVWDPSLGTWWQLKRELSNRERLQVENMRKGGMTLGEALARLNVLKK